MKLSYSNLPLLTLINPISTLSLPDFNLPDLPNDISTEKLQLLYVINNLNNNIGQSLNSVSQVKADLSNEITQLKYATEGLIKSSHNDLLGKWIDFEDAYNENLVREQNQKETKETQDKEIFSEILKEFTDKVEGLKVRNEIEDGNLVWVVRKDVTHRFFEKKTFA